MLPPTSSESLHNTVPTATVESNSSRPSGRKRKCMASVNPAITQTHSLKRIKVETESTTEPRASQPVEIPTDSIYDAIVTVKVGEMETSFGIHRGLLRRASRVFREALAFSETSEEGLVSQIMALKFERPDIFCRFKDWLYSGSIISESETCEGLAWSDLIAVYTFADRMGAPRLQNSCVDTAIKKRKAGGFLPAHKDVNTLWEASGRVLKLRKLLLNMFATECNLEQAMTTNGSYHPNFVRGLVQTLYDMKEKQTIYDKVDFWKNRRNYYVEENDDLIIID